MDGGWIETIRNNPIINNNSLANNKNASSQLEGNNLNQNFSRLNIRNNSNNVNNELVTNQTNGDVLHGNQNSNSDGMYYQSKNVKF